MIFVFIKDLTKAELMNKLPLLILICLSLLSLRTEAQNYMGIQFNYMQPLDEYKQNLDVHPKGIGLNYLFKPQIFKKMYIGAQIGISMYATDTYFESVDFGDGSFQDIEVEEEDCFFSYNLVGRYYLVEDKLLNPYLEARFGGLSFFSTKMTDEEYDEHYDNSTSFYGTSLQLGLGGGLSYHVVDNFWIDFNVIYNRGSRADYRNIGAADVTYRVDTDLGKFESYVHNVNYSLGVQFGF